ncbi:aldehyde dehydrogenase family protein, partial [Hydrogenibacillus schlegelii]|uniref:aldehyde dehydrogenase family protein n=1 Tax=Hydrogenibacillus schlegelii TaxID=1484 RepID=UPI0034A0686E
MLYTQSGKAARRFREEIDAGLVGSNVTSPLPVAFLPFGGHKDSFDGVIGENRQVILQFVTRQKTRSRRWFCADGPGRRRPAADRAAVGRRGRRRRACGGGGRRRPWAGPVGAGAGDWTSRLRRMRRRRRRMDDVDGWGVTPTAALKRFDPNRRDSEGDSGSG